MAVQKIYGDIEATPPITGGGGTSYRHLQTSASSTWIIDHPLGYKPAGILVWDSAGEEWEPAGISYPSDSRVVLDFAGNVFSGEALLS